MKAVVLREFGGPEVLRLEDVPDPEPGPGEVVVRVHAVSVNRTLDLEVRRGTYAKRVRLPMVLGCDPSGVVETVGSGVTHALPGERVAVTSHVRCGTCAYCVAGEEGDCTNSETIGVDRWGGYAELVAAPQANVYAIPEGLSFPEATVVTRHFSAAFHFLLDAARLEAGETILVIGAAGALGGAAVQVARLLGATVIAGAGSDERAAAAVGYGAQHGVNYRSGDVPAQVRALTGGRGVDVVLENTGDPTLWPAAFASLAPHGRLVSVGGHGGGVVPLDVKRLYLQRLRVIGAAGANRRDVERAIAAAAEGKVRAVIARVLPLAQAAEAHRLMEETRPLGKVILDPTR